MMFKKKLTPHGVGHRFKKKIVKRTGNYVFTNEFHDAGKDFATVGLRGRGPGKFGWGDWGNPPENEKAGFKYIQKVLVNHYAWFRSANPSGLFWLRS